MMQNENNPGKGLRMMQLIGGLPDDLVLSGKPESDPHAGDEKQENWFLRMMSSPAVAVALSLCVAFGAVFLIVRAGRGAGGRQPAGQLHTNESIDTFVQPIPENLLLPEGTITQIDISTLPGTDRRTLTMSGDIDLLSNRLLNMDLTPVEGNGLGVAEAWVMVFTYDDGGKPYELYEGGQILLVAHNDQVCGRFSISEEDEAMLKTLLLYFLDPQAPPEEIGSAPIYETETEPGGPDPGEYWAESMEYPTAVVDRVQNLTVMEYGAVVRIREMGEFINGEWVNKNPDLPGPRITSDEDWKTLFDACGMEAAEIERLTEWYRQFDNYDFVCVKVTESSGSNRVVPSGITVYSNGLLELSILEHIPSTGTCDIAYYCLIAAIPKDTSFDRFDRVKTVITTVSEQGVLKRFAGALHS